MKEQSVDHNPPSLNHNGDEYGTYIQRRRAAMKGCMSWKDDYFAFCVYVCAGTTQSFAAFLVGTSVSRLSKIFHKWVQILDTAVYQMFPRPTRNQMLKAFPAHFIKEDGHACTFLLLNRFEIFTQQSSNVNVASSTRSDYKKYCTIKFLGGINPVGCPWNTTVPGGNPGCISNDMATVDTKFFDSFLLGTRAKSTRDS